MDMTFLPQPLFAEPGILLLPILALVLLVVVGAIVGICLLLANKKTRTAGFVLLAVGFGVLVCGGGAVVLRVVGLSGQDYMVRVLDPDKPAPEAEITSESVTLPDTATSPDPDLDQPDVDKPDAAPEDKPTEKVEQRPDWVGRAPQRSGDAYQMSVTVGPYTSRMECDANMIANLQEEVAQYVEIILGPDAARYVKLPDNYIREEMIKDRWEEPVEASFGPMVQLHVLLEFDSDTRQLVEKQWHRHRVQQRLWYAGGGLGVGLLLLTLVYGYLKFGPGRNDVVRDSQIGHQQTPIEPINLEEGGRSHTTMTAVIVAIIMAVVVFVLVTLNFIGIAGSPAPVSDPSAESALTADDPHGCRPR